MVSLRLMIKKRKCTFTTINLKLLSLTYRMSLFLANFKFVEAHLLDQIANKSVRNLLGILISTNSTIIYSMNYIPVSIKIILHV